MRISLVVFLLGWLLSATAQIPEPYRPLQGGSFQGKPSSFSPDPIMNYQWSDLQRHDSLQYFISHPVSMVTEKGTKVSFRPELVTVPGNCDLRFDFGREYAAWAEFDCPDLTADVEMSISEYNEPAVLNSGAEHPVKTARPVRYGNSYRLELNKELYEGVRFVWIHCRNVRKPFVIRNLRLVCQSMPVNYQGSFLTDDSLLNRIWYTGAYVVRANLLQRFFGAILMERSDRHSWTGDAYPAQAASLVAFGNYAAVRKNIEYTSRLDNGIASYAMLWVLSLVDYYRYTGDSVFLRSMLPVADQHLTRAFHRFDSLPDLAFQGWDERLGAGFERPNLPECQAAYRFLCLDAWAQLAGAASILKVDSLACWYNGYYAEKSQWMSENLPPAGLGVHSVSHAINAGLLEMTVVRKEAMRIYGNRLQRLSYSPFNQYFIMQAMAKAGQLDAALTTTNDMWGGQLAYGGTTFFEVFRPSWNQVLQPLDAPPNNQAGYTSLAHPWGAGVTKWLTENVLGIRPLEPGFRQVEIRPSGGSRVRLFKGSVPTPHGVIRMDYDARTGRGSFVIPPGVIAKRVSLPVLAVPSGTILLRKNNRLVSSPAAAIAGGLILLHDLDAGTYEVDLAIGNTRLDLKQKEPPIQMNEPDAFDYVINDFQYDTVTSGNWQGRYGARGYYMAGPETDTSLLKMPAFMDSLRMRLNGLRIWDNPGAVAIPMPQALVHPTGRQVSPAAFITRDPIACLQTLTIDLYSKPAQSYQVSLYFLDPDSKGRRSAIEIFDAQTLEILAPVKVVDHYEKGTWVRFRCDRPVRLRLNQVRGENLALGGVFFD